MKKALLLIVGIIFLSMYVSAQETKTTTGEKEEITVEKTENSQKAESSVTYDGSLYEFAFFWKKKKEKAHQEHWSGLRLAFVQLDGLKDAELKQSMSYSISFIPVLTYHAIDNHWLFISGVGMDWTRYHFKGDVGLQGKSEITQFLPAPEDQHYKSSKLLTYYFTIPLVFEYQKKISHKNYFYMIGGVEGLIKYYSKSQVDIRTSDGIKKTSLGRDLNILPLNGRFVLQAGIGDLGIIGYYQPYSLFQKGKGPDVNPFGIGITLHL